MFGKVRKKLDRRMRRRIRKTSAVMLLISAITVAAIPVPEAAAADGVTPYAVTETGNAPVVTNSVKAVEADGRGGKIPWVTATDTIYTSDSGEFKFAYFEVPGEDYQAILLEYTGSAVSFDIPETLRAYIQYTTSQGTQNGYVAANQNGQALFYKMVRPVVYERTVVSGATSDNRPQVGDNTSWSGLSRVSDGTYSIVKKGQDLPSVTVAAPQWDGTRNTWIQQVSLYTYYYEPCVEADLSIWGGDDINRYTFDETNATGDADALQFYRMPQSSEFTQWNIDTNPITSALDQHLNDNNQEGNGWFSGPVGTREDWLQNANVGYISDQTVDSSSGTWKVGPSRGNSPFLSRGATVKTLTMPDTLIAVADYSFFECTSLEQVNMGSGANLSDIGSYAFASCTNMTTFSLDYNSAVKVISDHMLENCQKLTNFRVPYAVTLIADSAFAGCRMLSNIDFSGAGILKEIGSYVFKDCTALQEVTLPTDLEEMGWFNFENCSGLSKVVLGPGVGTTDATAIRYNNFAGCSNLECIDVTGNATTFDDTADLEYNAEKFKEEVSEKFYFIGENENSAIHKITENNAIAFMYRKTEIYEKIIISENKDGDEVKITYQVNKDNELIKLDVKGEPDEVVIEGVIGPYEINKLGNQFNNSSTTKLESITIPKTITEIGADAFKGCNSLREVHFEETNNIQTIGANAFQTQAGAPAGADASLTFFGEIREGSVPFDYAMNPVNKINDGNQKDVYIDFCSGAPTNLHVHYDPERGNSTLWKIPVTETNKDWGDDKDSKEYYDTITKVLKEEKPNAAEADIQAEITNLVKEFRENGTIAGRSDAVRDSVGAAFKIEVPSGVKSIAKNLFSTAADKDAEKTKLKGTNENNKVDFFENAMIGKYTPNDTDPDNPTKNFDANDDIQQIILHDIEKLDPYAFYGCGNLKTVQMYSSGVENGEEIGDYAFGQCEKLGDNGYVSLPTTTKTMGVRPFAGDKLLTGIQFVGESPTISGVETAPVTAGDNFLCDKGIIYEGTNESKKAVLECLEARGKLVGDIELGASELTGISSIYPEAFMNCDELTNINLAASNVKSIPEFCFNNAKNLTYLTLPNTCASVGHYAIKDTGIRRLTVNHPATRFQEDSLYDSDETNGYIVNGLRVSCVKDSEVADWVLEHEPYKWVISDEAVVWQYTIRFYDSRTEEGTGELIKEVKVDEQTTVPEPTEEERAPFDANHPGKYFNGWAPSNFSPAWKDMDVAAVYSDEKPEMYEVTFMNDDYSVIQKVMIQHGSYAPPQPTPVSTKGRFRFTGWSNTDGYSIYEPVTSNRTFFANYNYAGGQVSGNDPVDPDDPNNPGNPDDPNNPGNPDDPNNPGNNNGNGNGNGNNNGNGNGNGDNNSNSNKAKYTLTVVNGSGSGTYEEGTTVTVSAFTPNTGYEFYNWTSSESDTNFTSKTLSSTSFTMPKKNLTVTANYRTKSETNNGITSLRKPGTVTSSPSSNTGSVSKGDGSDKDNNSNSGSSVQISRPGISDGNVASATVNGSTDNFVIKITEDGQATAAVAEALRNEYGDLSNIHYFAMDISLYDETGTTKITDTSGLSVTITLPIPDELRQYAGNNKVAAVTGGNNLDKLNPRFTTVNGVPCVTFTATHFSPYTVYVDTANLSEGAFDTTPKTGDAIHPKWFLAIGLGLFSAVLFLKRDKKMRPETA